jgi:CDGSH-type Zn-finger protein
MMPPKDETSAEIQVTPAGPYQVVGGLPLSRTAQDETEFGEPIGYAPLEPVETGSSYRLCRCGRSGTKPFCDDSHALDPPFRGSEVADRGPRAARAQTFEGEGIAITDDKRLCSNAGYCGDRFAHVWEMLADSADPQVRERIRTMVRLCPSGRLASSPAPGEAEDEPAYEPEIAVFRDGPIWVRGGVRVVGADGRPYETRNRVLLCRCGHSRNRPFCDGTHKMVGFTDD